MKWFGESWGAPICDPDEHVERPDMPCMFCHDVLRDGDQGVIMPYLGMQGQPVWVAAHIDCFLRSVGVPLEKPTRVHILVGGAPLCRFSDRVPGQWPRGHVWVRILDWNEATCPGCLETAPHSLEWNKVIAERAAKIQAGEGAGRPAEQVFRDLLEFAETEEKDS